MFSPDHVYTVLDVETSDLDPATGRIIEISLVALDRNAREIGHLDTLVHPGEGGGLGRDDIHGITEGLVAGAPQFAEIAAAVSSFLAGTVCVAHYAKFDMGFLNAELDRAGHPMPAVASICTIEAARAASIAGPYGMAHVAARLGIRQGTAHHSLTDTRTCAAIFQRLLLRSRVDAASLARVRHARAGGAFASTEYHAPGCVRPRAAAAAALGEAV